MLEHLIYAIRQWGPAGPLFIVGFASWVVFMWKMAGLFSEQTERHEKIRRASAERAARRKSKAAETGPQMREPSSSLAQDAGEALELAQQEADDLVAKPQLENGGVSPLRARTRRLLRSRPCPRSN